MELYQTLSPLNRWLITLVVLAATLMQVIDTTIVNVALPHIQGSLSASSDEVTWILTCYMIASAILMPLTGYLSDRFGRKNFFIISIVGFTVVSALCGASMSLSEMIFFRILQGILGAGIVPLSQAILTDIFPPQERGKAMAIWGIGVMVGPILGPTLGGYLTEIATWRWTFYVNVPIGIFTLLFVNILPDTKKIARSMDWFGLALLSLSIGGLQFVLDQGNRDDWFNSTLICFISYFTVCAFVGFILHSMKNKTSVFDVRIFYDWNFSVACLLLCIFGLGLYGMMVIQPIMMENLYNYPPLITGFMLAPRGISGMISMMIVSKLITKVDPRTLIVSGILISVIGMWMGTHYSLNNMSPAWLIYPMILQGFGLGMVFVPLGTMAFSTLPTAYRLDATGLYSLLRTLGSSIGISITMTLYTRYTQYFWNELGGFINPYNSAMLSYLSSLHLSPQSAKGAAIMSGEIAKQASMLSFVNVFAVIMVSFILMVPLVLLLRVKTTAVAAQTVQNEPAH